MNKQDFRDEAYDKALMAELCSRMDRIKLSLKKIRWDGKNVRFL